MIENLLIYKCDVYHLKESTKTASYGLPGEKQYVYDPSANIKDAKCYYYGASPQFVPSQPGQSVTLTYKMIFPINTDVRLRDKIILNGMTFILEQPFPIRNDHIEVMAKRVEHEWQR